MKADYIDRDTAEKIIEKLTPINRCICRVCIETGLRIDDVCRLTMEQLRTADHSKGWVIVYEKKTGKPRFVRFSRALMQEMYWVSNNNIYVFENQRDKKRHRTRQRVWKDVMRVAREMRIDNKISPHSFRKLYAVEMYRKYNDLGKVQKRLNHDNMTTTLLYAMSDQLTAAGAGKGGVRYATRHRSRTPARALGSLKKGERE